MRARFEDRVRPRIEATLRGQLRGYTKNEHATVEPAVRELIAELKARRKSGWTPLHELALRPDLSVQMIEALGVHRKLAGTIQNFGGRTPLHTLLCRPDLFSLKDLENVIDSMVACNEQAVATNTTWKK